MNEDYSDDEALELQVEDQPDERWPANNSSERIRRSFASTDIAALQQMDTNEMGDESGREEMEEHHEALPQEYIDYYKSKFNTPAFNNKWQPPPTLDPRFHDLCNKAVLMCASGHPDGTVELFLAENIAPLFRKWYNSNESIDHWPLDLFNDMGATVIKVIKMMRGLLTAGAGSRDIPTVLWELFTYATGEAKPNHIIGDRLVYMNLELDESAERQLIKPEHYRPTTAIQKYVRMVVLMFHREGFQAAARFFHENITRSTPLEELIRYLKAFKTPVILLDHEKAYSSFAAIVFAGIERLTNAAEEEKSVKNLRGSLTEHPLYTLYQLLFCYANTVATLYNSTFLDLLKWRVKFCLKAVFEAPFNGKMNAADCLANLINEFNVPPNSRERADELHRWLEEERAVDLLTRENLHNLNFVDRVRIVFEQMLHKKIFTTGDLSTLWEAQRAKHDVIQRNLADVIVRITPYFDNELLEALFLKIQAGWVEGGVREREILIDIVRKIGENSAASINSRQKWETDQAQLNSSLETLWKFIRQKVPEAASNQQSAIEAHIKLLEEARSMGYIKRYGVLCAADIHCENEMASTAAAHLVRILELVDECDEEDDDYENSGRFTMIGELEESHSLVLSLCTNISKMVNRTEAAVPGRSLALNKFLHALAFCLHQNKDLTLSEAQASHIWESLISNPAYEGDINLGFKFFKNVVDSQAFAYAILERLFNKYVLILPPDTLNVDGYRCFEAFFKSVNDLQAKDIDFDDSPDNLLGSNYARELILQGIALVHDRASNLWVEYLQKSIERVSGPAMTARYVQSLVDLIWEQYDFIGVAVREAAGIGLAPTHNPAYEMAKDRTLRCLKVLDLLITGMDDDVGVGKRGVSALGRAAIGRPIFASLSIPKREWDAIPQEWSGHIEHTEMDINMDVHANTTVAELRDLLKKMLSEKMERLSRRRTIDHEVDVALEQFLLVYRYEGDWKAFHYSDYKRTLGEMSLAEVIELEMRFSRAAMRNNGQDSPETSNSESDWVSPEELDDDFAREAILPSRALAADEDMVERLLHVAESGDIDVAMTAFKILMSIPANETKLAQLQGAMTDPDRLLALLDPKEASDCRFVYQILMLESMILPAPINLSNDKTGLIAMTMFIRVLPRFAELTMLMNRVPAFRSLAIMSITRIINLACGTAARHAITVYSQRLGPDNESSGMIQTLIRLNQLDLPVKWSKHIRVRRLSANYDSISTQQERVELHRLLEENASLLMRVFCGVILSGSSFHSANPFQEDATSALVKLVGRRSHLLLESAIESDPYAKFALNGLLESAVHGMALLAAACPRQCAEFIGAVPTGPDLVFLHTVVSATFYNSDSVRIMAWQLTLEMVEMVRTTLLNTQQIDQAGSRVSLTAAALNLLPKCRGTDKHADAFVCLVRECVNRSKPWNAQIERLDYHIDAGIEFLEEALLNANADQQKNSYQDETYLKARIEVLRFLIRDASDERRVWLGSAEGGPRLCERLLADFIFPANCTSNAAAAAAAGDPIVCEQDSLPRSVTQMEMNSSSSLFDLRDDSSALPRSVSALPIATKRVAVCSGEASQDGIFQLLLALCDSLPVNQMLLQSTIYRLFYSSPWIDKKDFDYHPQHVLRGEGELVGLKNGGATCYMNAIFQQLFMIDEVREVILNANIPEKALQERRTSDSSHQVEHGSSSGKAVINREEYSMRVLIAVQTLFAHLLGSELISYRPAEFWKVFNFKPNGESVNVREQQDAVEFHNMLTEMIDEGLRQCKSEPICEKTFKGVFADEKICKDCPHRYTKEEAFECLTLDIRSHNNLKDSLKEFVKGDILENDNAYHCEQCDKKVKAIKRMSLANSKLPDVLIVQLKRFDFDWEKESAVKFNDYFEFPFDVDIQPYTAEGLEKMEKGETLEDNKDYMYKLRGVVVHSGAAQGGHYTSYIRNRETNKWFKFDDSDVSPWDASDGGAQQRWFGITDYDMQRGRKKIRTTYWNAYLLFYEKVESSNRQVSVVPSLVASDASTSSGVSSMATPMPPSSSSAVSPSPLSSSVSSSTATASTSETTTVTAPAVSPNLRDQAKRCGASASPVSNLHRHFSSMSLSSSRMPMPPRLEEMIREVNRRVQLERVQYSTHFFTFVTSATGKALTTADLNPECAEVLSLMTMKSFASFIVHNGLFASSSLMNEDSVVKCSFTSWISFMVRLLSFPTARLWFITHVLFCHDVAACFLFSSDPSVREFFQRIILQTIELAEHDGDMSEACLRPIVASPIAHQLANAIRQFPRLSYLLANLLGMLPFKHNAAFRLEPINFHRTIIELAEQPQMMPLIVKGGVLNNLLTLFAPALMYTDLSSLQRRDARVYEDLHRTIANLIRTIRPKLEDMPNPHSSDTMVIWTNEVPELRVLNDFKQGNGNIKFLQHLIDLLRRATRSSGDLGWASKGILFLCWSNARASAAVMDIVCQGLGNMLTETATEMLLQLLTELFMMDDGHSHARFEHVFYNVQLTSTHAHPSVQGLLEYNNVSESRYEVLLRVALAVIENMPGLVDLLEGDNRVKELLSSFNTIAVLKGSSIWCRRYHDSYGALHAVGPVGSDSSVLDSSGGDESLMESTSQEDEMRSVERGERGGAGGDRPTWHNQEQIIVSRDRRLKRKHTTMHHLAPQSSSPTSSSQLSPSSRMGQMAISNVGEKRPLPPTDEGEETDGSTDGRSDRKRSIGETMWRSGGGGTLPTPSPTKIDDYAASPMDDRELLISSSVPSTSRGPPTMPPPSYESIGGGVAPVINVGRALPALPLVPPPLPPRPSAIARQTQEAQTKPPYGGNEFVQEHRE